MNALLDQQQIYESVMAMSDLVQSMEFHFHVPQILEWTQSQLPANFSAETFQPRSHPSWTEKESNAVEDWCYYSTYKWILEQVLQKYTAVKRTELYEMAKRVFEHQNDPHCRTCRDDIEPGTHFCSAECQIEYDRDLFAEMY